MFSIATIASGLTSKIGGGVAWVLVIALTLGLGWLWVECKNWESDYAELELVLRDKDAKILALETELVTKNAQLRNKEAIIEALELQIEDLNKIIDDLEIQNIYMEEVLGRMETYPDSNEQPGGVINDKSSEEVIDMLNSFIID